MSGHGKLQALLSQLDKQSEKDAKVQALRREVTALRAELAAEKAKREDAEKAADERHSRLVKLADDHRELHKSADALAKMIDEQIPTQQCGILRSQLDAAEARCEALEAMPPPPPLRITFAEATILMEMFGGDTDPETTLSVDWCKDGHSGQGLYAWFDEYPEEGSTFLSPILSPAPDAAQPNNQQEQP